MKEKLRRKCEFFVFYERKKVQFFLLIDRFVAIFALFNNNIFTMSIKKVGFLLVLPALVCACGSDEEIRPTVTETSRNDVSAFRLSPQEAASAVSDFLSEQPANGVRGAVATDNREVEAVVDLEGARRTRGATALTDSVTKNFYFVTLKDGRGYAVVSKDKRTFPVFAVLDDGAFSPDSLNTEYMQYRLQQAQEGQKNEIAYFDHKWEEYLGEQKHTRSQSLGNKDTNYEEKTPAQMMADGWKKIREAAPKLKNVKWGQQLRDNQNGVFSIVGLPKSEAYKKEIPTNNRTYDGESFGCTSVAYGQVLYALRNYPGFRDLKYYNDEPVLWDNMNDSTSLVYETQRFLGWVTANCSPTKMGSSTMIFNTDAKDFIRSILGSYVHSRYDNCVVANGDFDGYGWSENARVVKEYFEHPDNCFVIMTAGASSLGDKTFGILSQFDLRYHTYVIDGIMDFNKRQRYGALFWKHWKTTVRYVYHINSGWSGKCNGYFLYVDSRDGFEYNGANEAVNYRSKASYFVIRPK